MKFTKYIAASLIACAGLTSCSDSFLDTEYNEYLGEEQAAEAAGKNPSVFLNGMWSYMASNLVVHMTTLDIWQFCMLPI